MLTGKMESGTFLLDKFTAEYPCVKHVELTNDRVWFGDVLFDGYM